MNKLVRISAWTGFPGLVEELGGDPAEVLAAAGLTPEDISQPDGFLPYEAFIRSLNAAAEATGRKDFGLISAAPGGLRVLGLLGIAIRNAPTIRAALEICARFIRINSSATTIHVVPIPNTTNEFISMENAYPLGPDTVQLYERMLSSLHAILRIIGREQYDPIELQFMHSRLAPTAAYETVLGKRPKFNQATMGLVLDSASMQAEIADRSAELGEMAMSHLRAFASDSDQSFADTSRTIAKVLIELGACTPADMANALSVHERTMQRRLRDAGVNFEHVRDLARREIADVLLRQDQHSLTQIAHILGYADSSTFTRSCQRWFGETPSKIRAQARTS